MAINVALVTGLIAFILAFIYSLCGKRCRKAPTLPGARQTISAFPEYKLSTLFTEANILIISF